MLPIHLALPDDMLPVSLPILGREQLTVGTVVDLKLTPDFPFLQFPIPQSVAPQSPGAEGRRAVVLSSLPFS